MLDWDSDNCPLTIGFLPPSVFMGTIRKPSIGNKEWVWSYYLSRALIAAIPDSKVDFLYFLYYVCSSWCKHQKWYFSGGTDWVIKGPYTLSDFNILRLFPLLSWLQRCILFLSILIVFQSTFLPKLVCSMTVRFWSLIFLAVMQTIILCSWHICLTWKESINPKVIFMVKILCLAP